MPATANTYQSGLMACMSGGVALLTDTIKLMLVASTETGQRDDDFVADLNEIPNVTNYVGGFGGAGRKPLASKALTVDDASDAFMFDAADVAFGNLGAGATIGGAVALKEVTNDAASPIICRCGTTDTATNTAAITVQFDALGLFRVTST